MSEAGGPTKAPIHYSISVRIRRVVTEEVHVLVPVTHAVMEEAPDGPRLDPTKVFAEAVRIGREDPVGWRPEGEPIVEIHPLQTPPPKRPDPAG